MSSSGTPSKHKIEITEEQLVIVLAALEEFITSNLTATGSPEESAEEELLEYLYNV